VACTRRDRAGRDHPGRIYRKLGINAHNREALSDPAERLPAVAGPLLVQLTKINEAERHRCFARALLPALVAGKPAGVGDGMPGRYPRQGPRAAEGARIGVLIA
jgi:hypothetical protein